jgi:hypothetical protein
MFEDIFSDGVIFSFWKLLKRGTCFVSQYAFLLFVLFTALLCGMVLQKLKTDFFKALN